MKRSIALLSVLLAGQLLTGSSPDTAPPDSLPAIEPDTSWVFHLEVGSRLYPDWKEEHTVRFGEEFYLGDTELVALVRDFVPDFRMKNGEVVNWSTSLANPAAYVHVLADSGAIDSVWAFQNFPPHFSPRSFYSFKLLEMRGYRDPALQKDEGEQ